MNMLAKENVNKGSRSVFVGDLSLFCNEQRLYDLFIPCGVIESVVLKSSNDNKPHLSYGFVKFRDHSSAARAITEFDGHLFLGRAIRVAWASDTPEERVPIEQRKQERSKTIATAQIHVTFNGNDLPIPITDVTLRELFSQFGPIIDVVVKKSEFNPRTGIQTGYGFVHYPLNEQGIASAYLAIQQLHQMTIHSVSYECRFSHGLKDYLQTHGYLTTGMSSLVSANPNPYGMIPSYSNYGLNSIPPSNFYQNSTSYPQVTSMDHSSISTNLPIPSLSLPSSGISNEFLHPTQFTPGTYSQYPPTSPTSYFHSSTAHSPPPFPSMSSHNVTSANTTSLLFYPPHPTGINLITPRTPSPTYLPHYNTQLLPPNHSLSIPLPTEAQPPSVPLPPNSFTERTDGDPTKRNQLG